MKSQLSEFGTVLIFILGGALFLTIMLLLAKVLRPSKPNPEKLTTYESGEEAIGTSWTKFNVKYYTIALIFILFEVEIVFLFPWATIFTHKDLIKETNGNWGWLGFTEVCIFIGILSIGLVYAWAKGYIDWIKPTIQPNNYKGLISKDIYNKFNLKYNDKSKADA